MAFVYAVALTGSIATGKSTVVNLFLSWGFEVIDADKIAHEILNEQRDAILSLFGDIVIKGGQVDRKALGSIVFNDKGKRKQLEALLHPLIYKRIERLSETLDKMKKPYFIDIPLFYETKRYPIAKTLVVYAPVKLQLQRLMKRENLTQKEAQKRIDIQISVEEKRKHADYVIDNSGTLTALKYESLRIKDEIVGDFR